MKGFDSEHQDGDIRPQAALIPQAKMITILKNRFLNPKMKPANETDVSLHYWFKPVI